MTAKPPVNVLVPDSESRPLPSLATPAVPEIADAIEAVPPVLTVMRFVDPDMLNTPPVMA